ncbi:hypothetical protein F5Y18DRAFT_286029 [Xylariaceae sp. FL1019]|nr:hypothetical protein F5Y18DRAFT_286029 [Xylariaceae sp. FL1019]
MIKHPYSTTCTSLWLLFSTKGWAMRSSASSDPNLPPFVLLVLHSPSTSNFTSATTYVRFTQTPIDTERVLSCQAPHLKSARIYPGSRTSPTESTPNSQFHALICIATSHPPNLRTLFVGAVDPGARRR